MVTSSLVLTLLFAFAATDVFCRSISEEQMQALLDGADAEQVNDEQASDAAALDAEGVQDVKPLKANKSDEDVLTAEDAMPFGDDMDMKALFDNPEFQNAFAEVEKMQKEDPEKFEKMMQESMQAMQEMMQDPEAMQAMMQGLPEELMAEVAAESKANELVNGMPQAPGVPATTPAA